jgi:hypothetical protein
VETPRRNRREGGGLQVAVHAEVLAAELETEMREDGRGRGAGALPGLVLSKR